MTLESYNNLASYSIDVIIPLYNCQKFIIDAIQSVESQTIGPAKIIVVNDGSTDNSLEVVNQYKSSIPIQVINKLNGGVSSARNTGIQASTAEFIAFLDADDEWVPDKLEQQLKVFIAQPCGVIGAVFSRFILIDENGHEVRQKTPFRIDPNIRKNARSILVQANVVGSPSAVMVRRTCLDVVGYFDEKLAGGEDCDLWLRIAEISTIDYVDKELVRIRKHNHNAQNDSGLMFRNQMFFCNKWAPQVNNRYLLRRWGRSLLVQLITKLPSTDNLRIARQILSKETKKRLFSVGFLKFRFYKMGLIFSVMQSIFLVFIKLIRYNLKKMRVIKV